MNGQKKKSAGNSGATLRFELEIASQTDDSTNEFSYAHLVEDALKKVLTFYNFLCYSKAASQLRWGDMYLFFGLCELLCCVPFQASHFD